MHYDCNHCLYDQLLLGTAVLMKHEKRDTIQMNTDRSLRIQGCVVCRFHMKHKICQKEYASFFVFQF